MSFDSKISHRRSLKPLLLSIATAAALTITTGAAVAVDITPELRAVLKRDLGVSAGELPQRLEAEAMASRQEAEARRQLGASFAGGWLERASDGTTKFVVAAANGAKANIPGVEVRNVRFSMNQLSASLNRLNAQATLPMTAKLPQIHTWRIDVPSNSIVVRVDPEAIDDGIDFVAASGADAGMVRFETGKERPATFIDVFGGQRYNMSNGGWCSTGFNARNSSGVRFVITAGHCARVGTTTTLTSGAGLGVFDGSVFPSRDWAVIRITNGSIVQRGRVVNYAGGSVLVSGSAVAAIGAQICRSGARTGYRCGTVRATNVTVNYGGQIVTGLTETTACAGQGDSGGSYITPAGQAQGVCSGGILNGATGENCSLSAPITWHQPVNPILANYGLSLLLGP